jgi:hypothetical protein
MIRFQPVAAPPTSSAYVARWGARPALPRADARTAAVIAEKKLGLTSRTAKRPVRALRAGRSAIDCVGSSPSS